MQLPAQISHSFFGRNEAKRSALFAAVNPNLYATEPIGFNLKISFYMETINLYVIQID